MNRKIISKDGHIHSHYCPHGTKDNFEQYIEKALELGLEEISFTEHMSLPSGFMDAEFLRTCSPSETEIEDYLKELDQIKEKYEDRIKINTGLEVDYIEGLEGETTQTLNRFGKKLSDSILSVHFIKIDSSYYCIDFSPEEFGRIVKIAGSVEKVYDKYYETVLKAVKADLGLFKPRRIGHLTLVRKFNKVFPTEYNNPELLEEIVKEIKLRNYEIDFNTAGVRKPFCGEVYPSGVLAELINKYDINIVYGSDAHSAEEVGSDFFI
jgi:histidinol-phosphatase (PHP family)